MRRYIFLVVSLLLIVLGMNTDSDAAIHADTNTTQRLVVFEGFLRPT